MDSFPLMIVSQLQPHYKPNLYFFFSDDMDNMDEKVKTFFEAAKKEKPEQKVKDFENIRKVKFEFELFWCYE